MSSLAKALAAFMGASFIGSLTQVAKGKITAVVLGPEGVGVLNQLTMTWNMFNVASGLGFYNGMVRHLTQRLESGDRELLRQHMSSSSLFLLGCATLVAALGVVFSTTISDLVFADGGQRSYLVALILLSVPLAAAGQNYRALLNSGRAVGSLVKARIGADMLSVVALAALIYPFGLEGAILGFIALHAFFLAFSIFAARSAIGSDVVIPNISRFRWHEIRMNIGYGINGLITVTAGIATAITVSRWIISSSGFEENGLFSVAIKVTTVYLGGIYASTSSYYYPLLLKSKSNNSRHLEAFL